jgi:hypothetical protein
MLLVSLQLQASMLFPTSLLFSCVSLVQVSTDIIQISAVGNFSTKTEGTKTKSARFLFFLKLAKAGTQAT